MRKPKISDMTLSPVELALLALCDRMAAMEEEHHREVAALSARIARLEGGRGWTRMLGRRIA